jgi:hypothetical protein
MPSLDEASRRHEEINLRQRNRRADMTDKQRSEINRRQREYQCDCRAQRTEEEREEMKRKQREYQRQYRAQKKAASQYNSTPNALTQTVPTSSTIGT